MTMPAQQVVHRPLRVSGSSPGSPKGRVIVMVSVLISYVFGSVMVLVRSLRWWRFSGPSSKFGNWLLQVESG